LELTSPLHYCIYSPLLSAPHNQEIVEVCFFIPASGYPVCGCRCAFFRPFFSCFYFTSLTFNAGLQL